MNEESGDGEINGLKIITKLIVSFKFPPFFPIYYLEPSSLSLSSDRQKDIVNVTIRGRFSEINIIPLPVFVDTQKNIVNRNSEGSQN